MKKRCQVCQVVFEKSPYCSLKEWSTRKFCSRKCTKGNRDLSKVIKRMKENNPAKLKHNRLRMKKNNPMAHGGETAYKRDDYKSIHAWVYRKLGRPDTCEVCKAKKGSVYKLHWANLDHKYERDVTKWRRMCPKCHVKYDRQMNLKK